ncbi:glycosyltransferase family 2 protein [Erythrobacter sp. THAF29]|uniref:glycosyltransferase family 2 protein n=1 Tax=Erythrobacter sp. THAF29 TaxID=2587851 RepID=UPI0012AA4CDA|nr:glycosyltransferase family 2 protein [Erythrobacter sp. THAF29]QFT78701.1 N-glycosyltransferase [Erythrobacter sp. THAF29]
MISLTSILVTAFIAVQVLYLLCMLVEVYFYTRPINRVDVENAAPLTPDETPYIVLFYPVLRELEETMRTTFHSLSRMEYPRDRYSVIAIPNSNDYETVESLRRLQREFDFLSIIEVPPTTDPSWQPVWDGWESNPKAYWFHHGPRAGFRDLPPKKTRQLIYAFYKVHKEREGADFLVNYIDADSAPGPDHFTAGAIGMRDYDVLQATNIAGNLLHSMPATWYAFDHLTWDASKYAHLTANGTHPFWVLGKGLFFRASDLYELGSFHPWLTIEDPEVGMRFWKNGRKLGLIERPLIEEVPETLENGITQRKRWVAGFLQSLDVPLKEMGYTPIERLKAWLNFLPCLSLILNAVGVPLGIWAGVTWWMGTTPLPEWSLWLAGANAVALFTLFTWFYINAWRKTRVVLPSRLQRLWYLIRVNPLSLVIHWFIWIIPLWIGWRMYRTDGGLVWERTVKIDANNKIVRGKLGVEHLQPANQIDLSQSKAM